MKNETAVAGRRGKYGVFYNDPARNEPGRFVVVGVGGKRAELRADLVVAEVIEAGSLAEALKYARAKYGKAAFAEFKGMVRP